MPPQTKNALAAIRSPGGLRKSVVVQMAHAEGTGDTYQFTMAPEDGYLESVEFGSWPPVARSDTNYATFEVVNRTRDGGADIKMLADLPINTTKSTGGQALKDNGTITLQVHPTLANTKVRAGDRLRVAILITGTLPEGSIIFPCYLLRFVPL